MDKKATYVNLDQKAMYINGEWIKLQEQIEINNPATQEVFATVPKGGVTEAKQAVDAAHEAFKSWSKLTAADRAQKLKKWFTLIDENKEEIAAIMTKEQGKPFAEALGEVNYANSFVEWYAEEGKRVYGEMIPASHPNKRILVTKQPVGVIAAITPWNFPAAMITRKVAPALAAGCTAVVKPASQTPLTALKLAELAHEADIPKGVLNIVTGSAKAIADTWMEDGRVRKVSFTGSTEIGKELMCGAAKTMKKVSLELGGHAPFIVMNDADLDKAVEAVIGSKFRNAGQTCICTNRVFVQEAVYGEFAAKFQKAVGQLKVGDGFGEGTTVGPLIDANAVEKVQEHIEDAIKKGGEILYGGQTLTELNGHFIEPTVIGDANDTMLCMTEETFGPVAPVAKFETVEEVIERANNTPYGLAAYVFTKDISQAFQISEALEYGIIGLNDGLPSVAQAPFGGFKESGIGREGGHFGIEEYLEIKYISLGL
ncbi:NAD-dependent succinate-semialdehyde dehydrogenase [Bacillus sp. Xin]|uniref:NAD-dependent succinate-semialdehyde dehydrogenase n=1 Tax=unclassified Bacillus (in: firmicutes) TaxID=185979 RepID=UPI001574DA47|nr:MULTISPECIES: NAD-dependent succinate-semialdehyde dehydrogenase [unclassified Bacillus (in: firmicutes)]MBC6971831.1 NAD-dependent succinate-semialdehyde dehydrogenase [Bacillus sp. Xin]MCI0766304.1 NAD-dependent succinate-semialdehyde dehydrogenase [Bacillus sp. TL12]NSW37980.1 NAD-dependent succinate-semialdehyde dehydrogenase [Bacillus sp. Xin1]